MKNKCIYPIRYVVRQTGLSAHVIRAWERRYCIISPERTDSNRRLYSQRDVQHLRLLNEAVKAGHSISQLTGLSIDAIQKLVDQNGFVEERRSPHHKPDSEDKPVNIYIGKCLTSIESLDAVTLEKQLDRAMVDLTRQSFLEKLIVPLMHRVGEMWEKGVLKIINEHLASSVIQSFLWEMMRSARSPEKAPGIVVSTPSGQRHELGALIIAVSALEAGWKVHYYGPDLPAEEITSAVNFTKASAVALSIVYSIGEMRLHRELTRLKRLLPESVVLLVGGRAVTNVHDLITSIGANAIEDLNSFKSELSTLLSTSP